MPKTEAPKPDPEAWPTTRNEQIRAIQTLLGQLKLMRAAPTGNVGPITTAAIREYQRTAGLPQTGEPSRELLKFTEERGPGSSRSRPTSRTEQESGGLGSPISRSSLDWRHSGGAHDHIFRTASILLAQDSSEQDARGPEEHEAPAESVLTF